METRLTLRPGMPGTRKLQIQYGEQLVCVRYLYDEASGTRLKTVELVIDKTPWNGKPRRPRKNDTDLLGIRIEWDEIELRRAIKASGAIWLHRQRLWEVAWKTVRALRLQNRVVDDKEFERKPQGLY